MGPLVGSTRDDHDDTRWVHKKGGIMLLLGSLKKYFIKLFHVLH